jgi:hypothetical protein
MTSLASRLGPAAPTLGEARDAVAACLARQMGYDRRNARAGEVMELAGVSRSHTIEPAGAAR